MRKLRYSIQPEKYAILQKVMKTKYSPSEDEIKWQKIWEEKGVFKPDLDKAKKPFYNLMMFPYLSAEGLHAGNMYAFTGADIFGRYMRMNGKDVFEPIGLDGFGIHSENYALKIGKHPMEQTKISEKKFYKQLRLIGNGYDWDKTVETYDPDYYKWTQWIFIQMFKKGLAVKKKSPVNFCPSCKTTLADEQVIDGKCERCDSIIEKKNLEQWFFKITDYAERLLNNIPSLNWAEKVKIAQTNWIGKSEGVTVKFKVEKLKQNIEVFTTRPDTLFGATFLVLAPEHELVNSLLNSNEIKKYVEKAKKKSDIERQAVGKEKTGVFTGLYAVNPTNKEEIPIWIADYVLFSYGTGAIMAVPAHDQRDFEFAKKYNLCIKEVIKGGNIAKEAYMGQGEIINSNDLNGFEYPKDKEKIITFLSKKGIGKKEVHFHLRDWLISRQRYWGSPIPIIYCLKCGPVAVPEKDLPVKLPFIKNYKPIGTGKSPLASDPEFYKTKCPDCNKDAVRETDVSDTFLDSAWYFFRYVSTERKDRIFDKERVKKWLPVDMYIGGAEHSVLHLLYSRFMTMVLYDLGLIDFEEPYKRFFAHGLLIREGAKMSKSKGNVITPDKYIAKFGADTMRCYLMFIGQFREGGDFYDTGIEGMNRFLRRIWVFSNSVSLKEFEEDREVLRMINKTVKEVTRDINKLSYNTAIAKLMEFYNSVSGKKSIGKNALLNFLKLLAPFAPHLTEELYQSKFASAKEFNSIHNNVWPLFEEKYLIQNEALIVIQINGKVRDTLRLNTSDIKDQKKVEEAAGKSEKVKAHLKGKKIKKIIYIQGKILNFVAN
ncbi:MAG: leucine--tRNA ligase [Candidatus Levyibacteriota bacterium]